MKVKQGRLCIDWEKTNELNNLLSETNEILAIFTTIVKPLKY